MIITIILNRCQKLHDWIRALTNGLHLLPEHCQTLFFDFLLLDPDEKIDSIIIQR